jgi:hypothetical protein
MKKSYLLALAVSLSLPISLMAATSAPAGAIAAVSSLSTSSSSIDLGNLATTQLADDTTLGTFLFSNNDVDGYTITIASTNSGEFRANGKMKDNSTDVYNNSKAGTFVAYTVDVSSSSNTGTTAAKLSSTGTSLSSNLVLTVDDPTSAISASTLTIATGAAIAASTGRFEGTMDDTITVTLADRD